MGHDLPTVQIICIASSSQSPVVLDELGPAQPREPRQEGDVGDGQEQHPAVMSQGCYSACSARTVYCTRDTDFLGINLTHACRERSLAYQRHGRIMMPNAKPTRSSMSML